MPMESRRPGPAVDAAAIVGVLGGVLLIVGAQLSWGTISVNLGRFAAATGVDISQLPQGMSGLLGRNGPIPGLVLTGGKVALNVGVVALVAAITYVFGIPRKVTGVVLVLAGAVAAGFAVYYAVDPSISGIDQVSNAFISIGLRLDFKSLLDIGIGIGVWICVAGGVLAIVGGILAVRSTTAVPRAVRDGVPEMPPAPPAPPVEAPGAGGDAPTG
jgi:hypothetical protein